MTYVIRFEFLDPGWGDRPPTVWYAGWTAGDPPQLGIAPGLATAATWDDREVAERWLANGYGEEMRMNGKVVAFEDASDAAHGRAGRESPDGPDAREEVDCGPTD